MLARIPGDAVPSGPHGEQTGHRSKRLMQRVRIVVRGRVQGVSFRAYARREALRLGLTGWVRNRPDGAVEMLAEGPTDRLEALADWARRGPALARVDEVEVEWSEASGAFHDFSITA